MRPAREVLIRALFAAALVSGPAPAALAASREPATRGEAARPAEGDSRTSALTLGADTRIASSVALSETRLLGRHATVGMSARRQGAPTGSSAADGSCSRARRGRTLTRGLQHARRRARARSPVLRRARGRRRSRARGSPASEDGDAPLGSGAALENDLCQGACAPGTTGAVASCPSNPRHGESLHARAPLVRLRPGVLSRWRGAPFTPAHPRSCPERERARRARPKARHRAREPSTPRRRGRRRAPHRRRAHSGRRARRPHGRSARRSPPPLSRAASSRTGELLAPVSAPSNSRRRRRRACVTFQHRSATPAADLAIPDPISYA